MKNKRLKIGTYTALTCVIAIAIVVLVNMLVGSLPSTYTRFDVSTQGIYDISDDTKEIVKSINSDITLYLLATQGEESNIVEEMLSRYTAINSHIKYKIIDPVLHPTFESKSGNSYTLSDYTTNTVIVCGDIRDKVIEYSEIFQTEYSDEDYYNYYYYGVTPTGTTSFYGEAKLTGALQYVTQENVAKVYVTTGHGESEFGENLSGYLSDDSYTVETISLISTEIPDDASCIVINNLTSDINENELSALESYVDGGGKLVLVTGYSGSDISELENVCKLGSYYGMEGMDGIAVEGSNGSYISGYPYYILATQGATDINSAVGDSRSILMAYSHGLSISENLSEDISVDVLLKTTSSGYITNGETVSQDDATYTGTVNLGLMATKTDEDEGTEGNFVWFSSSAFLDDSADSMVSGGNSVFFLSTLNVLCEKEESVSIAAKSMAAESLVVSDSAANLWSTLLGILIPLTIVVCGLLYFAYRRKR